MRNEFIYGRHRERHRLHREADGVNRADAGLRSVAREVGDAVMCRKCDGYGYFMNPLREDPMKCTRCGGEGLEPPE